MSHQYRYFRIIYHLKKVGATTTGTWILPFQIDTETQSRRGKKICAFAVEWVNTRFIDTPVSATTANQPIAVVIPEFRNTGVENFYYQYQATGTTIYNAAKPTLESVVAILDPNGSANGYRDPNITYSKEFKFPITLEAITIELRQLGVDLSTYATLNADNEFITLSILFKEQI